MRETVGTFVFCFWMLLAYESEAFQ